MAAQIDRHALSSAKSVRSTRAFSVSGILFMISYSTRYRTSLRDRQSPVEQPAGEVDPYDRAGLVAGEEAALPLHTAAGDDVLVSVAWQQADVGRRGVWGALLATPRPT